MESTITKQHIITMLLKSPHGDLKSYIEPVKESIEHDQEFTAHLIAHNYRKGSIRNSKVALPFITLSNKNYGDENLCENSFAHLALLTPRQLSQGFRNLVIKELMTYAQCMKKFRDFVTLYLRAREQNNAWWDATAIQHRKSMVDLYSLFSIKPSSRANMILYHKNYPDDTVFYAVKNMHMMNDLEAAGKIIGFNIPFLVVKGALGARLKEPNILLALIEKMSPTELVTNAKFLQNLGVKDHGSTRAAFDEALKKARTSNANVLKTTRAAQALAEDDNNTELVAELEDLQERQLDNQKGIDGNWAILADKSGSMSHSIELSRHIAAILARLVNGQVHLIFFDGSPRGFNVAGETFKDIEALTKYVHAGGNTSIGSGLQYLLSNNIDVDGIAIISDGGENTVPFFHSLYPQYTKRFDKEVPVYFYHVDGEGDRFTTFMNSIGVKIETFDLTKGKIDYYSLPNIVQTMRTNRFSLVDEIYATPLLRMQHALRVPKRFMHASNIRGTTPDRVIHDEP